MCEIWQTKISETDETAVFANLTDAKIRKISGKDE